MGYARRFDQKLASQKHYDENKQLYKERAKAHNAKALKRNKRITSEHLRSHPCVDCGESDIDVLDFDHVRGEKADEVTRMAHQCVSAEKLLREIAKCEIRCANCHRKATKRRRNEAKTQESQTTVRVEISIQLDLFG